MGKYWRVDEYRYIILFLLHVNTMVDFGGYGCITDTFCPAG